MRVINRGSEGGLDLKENNNSIEGSKSNKREDENEGSESRCRWRGEGGGSTSK